MKNVYNNKSFLIVILLFLIASVIYFTYAAFDYGFVGGNSSIEKSSVFVKLLENKVIDLNNSLPVSDEMGINGEPFDFSVVTNASYDTVLKYSIGLEKLSADNGYTSLNDNEVKVYLTDFDDNKLVDSVLVSNLDNGVLYEDSNKHSSTNTEIIKKYKIRLWIDKDVNASSWNSDTKIQYKAKIVVKLNEEKPGIDLSSVVITNDNSEIGFPSNGGTLSSYFYISPVVDDSLVEFSCDLFDITDIERTEESNRVVYKVTVTRNVSLVPPEGYITCKVGDVESIIHMSRFN